MPTILEVNGYRFSFFAADCQERPHVHVTKENKTAKFWFLGGKGRVELFKNYGFSDEELHEIQGIIIGNKWTLKERWKKFCRDAE